MSGDAHHDAMALVDEGEQFEAQGLMEAARVRFEQAAVLEQQAADAAAEEQVRARAILRVSAVSAWMRARRYDDASSLARRYLGESLPAGFARELHELVNELETHRRAAARLPHVSDTNAREVIASLEKIETALAKGQVLRAKVTLAA
jgi:hypothetical protein